MLFVIYQRIFKGISNEALKRSVKKRSKPLCAFLPASRIEPVAFHLRGASDSDELPERLKRYLKHKHKDLPKAFVENKYILIEIIWHFN